MSKLVRVEARFMHGREQALFFEPNVGRDDALQLLDQRSEDVGGESEMRERIVRQTMLRAASSASSSLSSTVRRSSEDLFLYRGVQVSFSQISRARVSSGLSAYRAKCRSTSRCCAGRRSQAFEPDSHCDPPDTGNYPKPSSTRRAVSESPSSHRLRAVLFDVVAESTGTRRRDSNSTSILHLSP